MKTFTYMEFVVTLVERAYYLRPCLFIVILGVVVSPEEATVDDTIPGCPVDGIMVVGFLSPTVSPLTATLQFLQFTIKKTKNKYLNLYLENIKSFSTCHIFIIEVIIILVVEEPIKPIVKNAILR